MKGKRRNLDKELPKMLGKANDDQSFSINTPTWGKEKLMIQM